MLGITTPPLPVCLLLLDNLLRYRDQPQLNLICDWILPLGPGALGGARQGLHCLVEVFPSCPAPINSPESSMMSGEAGWTVRVHIYTMH